jgi:hypothetical protein
MKARWAALLIWLCCFAVCVGYLAKDYGKPRCGHAPSGTQTKNCGQRQAPSFAHHRDEQNEKGNQKGNWIEGVFERPTDTLLVLFNGLLVVVTLSLASATSKLMEETRGLRERAVDQRADMLASINATRDAARAASRSAEVAERALVDLERAYIFLNNANFVVTPMFNPQHPVITREDGTKYIEAACNLDVRYSISNAGRTPAVIDDIKIRGFIATNQKLLEIPDGYFNVRGILVLAGGVKKELLTYHLGEFSSSQFEAIKKNTRCAFFVGEITYKDIFNRRHVSSFAVRTDCFDGKVNTTAAGCEAFNFQETLSAGPKKDPV